MNFTRRKVLGAVGSAAVAYGIPGTLFAQQNVVRIGMSMPQTGSLGAGGRERPPGHGPARKLPGRRRRLSGRGERSGRGPARHGAPAGARRARRVGDPGHRSGGVRPLDRRARRGAAWQGWIE